MEFKLNEDQIKRLNEWKESIKEAYGKYGLYKYSFCPNGIGMEVKVWSCLAREWFDLSDVDKW